MKLFLTFLILLRASGFAAFSEEVIVARKAAKVGNEIILTREVEKYAGMYKIPIETAKKELIDEAVLYQGAMMYCDAPTVEEINYQIRDDKMFYAKQVGKKLADISDEELANFLLSFNVSVRTYRENTKKQLWIKKYIKSEVLKVYDKNYIPTEKEVKEIFEKMPDLFLEREGIYLSLIYFSFFDNNGKYIDDEKKETKRLIANKCLNEIKKDEDFPDYVVKYSNDLLSQKSDVKGSVGFLAFDDPRTETSFSKEILFALKTANEGVIKKIFDTYNGLYIFKIDAKVSPRKLNDNEARLKAESYLHKQYEDSLYLKVRNKLLDTINKQIDVEVY